MRVLLACEESQAVCIEFRKLGHEAYSCDLKPCGGGHPEWHKQGDVMDIIGEGWDTMIAFPPCTHLALSGAAWFEAKRKDGRQQEGIDFFMNMVHAPIERIGIENPMGIMSRVYRKPDQIIHPYHFGDPFQKTTCLWLKNLPKLKIEYHDSPLFGVSVDKGEMFEWTDGKSGKTKKMPLWYAQAKGFGGKGAKDHGEKRSKTFNGIARAMADQWSKL